MKIDFDKIFNGDLKMSLKTNFNKHLNIIKEAIYENFNTQHYKHLTKMNLHTGGSIYALAFSDFLIMLESTYKNENMLFFKKILEKCIDDTQSLHFPKFITKICQYKLNKLQ